MDDSGVDSFYPTMIKNKLEPMKLSKIILSPRRPIKLRLSLKRDGYADSLSELRNNHFSSL